MSIQIYALTDPHTDNIRYIGKANNAEKRLKTHILDSRRRNTPVYCWLRKLLDLGTVPGLVILREVEQNEWIEAERELIFFHRATGARLLNLAEGGDQPFCSKEQRAENGRRTIEKICSDPERKRIWQLKLRLSQALSKGHCNEATKGKMREAARKRPDLFGCWANI